MFTIHSQEIYDACLWSPRKVCINTSDPKETAMLDPTQELHQDLEDALTILVRLHSPEDVLEALAKAYQSKRDKELQNWFDYGNGKECAVKAFKADQISQKLLRVIRELEER